MLASVELRRLCCHCCCRRNHLLGKLRSSPAWMLAKANLRITVPVQKARLRGAPAQRHAPNQLREPRCMFLKQVQNPRADMYASLQPHSGMAPAEQYAPETYKKEPY